jgi:hypothetical protein
MPTRDPSVHLQHAFVREGRLTSLPRRERMIVAACEFVAARFEHGREYAEPEVNALLGADAPDHATLRRLLVDRGYLRRAASRYRRAASSDASPKRG